MGERVLNEPPKFTTMEFKVSRHTNNKGEKREVMYVKNLF